MTPDPNMTRTTPVPPLNPDQAWPNRHTANADLDTCNTCTQLTSNPKQHRAWTHCTTCHHTWTSRRDHHCTQCHRHFGGLGAFDKHQTDSEPVVCKDPASVGLIDRDGVWGRPAPENAKWAGRATNGGGTVTAHPDTETRP